MLVASSVHHELSHACAFDNDRVGANFQWNILEKELSKNTQIGVVFNTGKFPSSLPKVRNMWAKFDTF